LQQDPQNAGGAARVNLVASAAPSIVPLLFLYCCYLVGDPDLYRLDLRG
jgi:hypothetical protein